MNSLDLVCDACKLEKEQRVLMRSALLCHIHPASNAASSAWLDTSAYATEPVDDARPAAGSTTHVVGPTANAGGDANGTTACTSAGRTSAINVTTTSRSPSTQPVWSAFTATSHAQWPAAANDEYAGILASNAG